ncbi:MAG: Ig-like domain-containing protein [Marinifilaceae bacterium]
MKKILNLFLMLSLIGLMSSCIMNEDGTLSNEIQAAGIIINPASLTLKTGNSHKLIAIVIPMEFNKTITWESLSPEIASVNANGIVTAIKKGKVRIIATADNVTAACNVTVTGEGSVDPDDDEDDPVVVFPKLDEIFSGNLTVTENTTGNWWTNVAISNFTCEFIEKLEDGVFVFDMKGFWFPQMEGSGSYNWAKAGDKVLYYAIPVTINVKDPENPTYTVTHPDDSASHCILTVNEGVKDKFWWVGFEPVSDKAIEIDYKKKEMTFHYNVSAGESGKWNLDYDFILTMIWD